MSERRRRALQSQAGEKRVEEQMTFDNVTAALGYVPGLGSGSGTVTSVALSAPAIFSVAGSPVTGAGTLALSLATQSANLVWAGPTTGSPATPTFRALVNADFPTSGVSAGAYTNANVTVNAQGIVTAIANGSAGGGSVAVVTDSSTARVAALTDADKLIEFTNAAAITYTIPPQSSVAWAADTVLYAAQGSTGQVTFVAGSGVTIETPDTLKSRAQESIIGVKRMAADVWEAFGDLEGYITAASVLGRSAATNGAPAAIASSADGEVFRRSGTTLGWGTIATAGIADSAVTLAKIANASANSKLLGSGASGSGSAYTELALGTNLSMSGTTLNASAGSGAMTNLGTATVSGSAATTLAISGLDLSAYKGFYILATLDNATASAATVSLYYNADTTATNYYRQQLLADNAVVGASRGNDGAIASMIASEPTILSLLVLNDRDSKPRAISHGNRGATATLSYQQIAHAWTSATNVTGVTFSSSVANSLAVGSTFTVFGVS